MDKPISTPDSPAGRPPEDRRQPAAEERQGAMGGRRVSGAPFVAQPRSLRPSAEAGGTAGVAAVHRRLDSRRAAIATSIPEGDAPTVGRGATGGAGRQSRPAERVPDYITTNLELRSRRIDYEDQPASGEKHEIFLAIERVSKRVLRRFKTLAGKDANLAPYKTGETNSERAYAAMREMAHKAECDGNSERAQKIREELTKFDRQAASELDTLSRKYRWSAFSSVRASPSMRPVTVRDFEWCGAFAQLQGIQRFFDQAGQSENAAQVGLAVLRIESCLTQWFQGLGGNEVALLPPGGGAPPGPVQRYRALQAMARRSAERGRGTSDATASEIARKALEEIDLLTVRQRNRLALDFGSLNALAARLGLHPQQLSGFVPIAPATRAGVGAGQPPPGSATPAAAAAVPAGSSLAPPWLEDDFAVERALLAGQLPPGFDASQLIVEAGTFAQFGLDTELAAGRLPMPAIHALLEGYEITDREGSNALFIDYLRSLKENIEQALAQAYPGRVGQEWLDRVREVL